MTDVERTRTYTRYSTASNHTDRKTHTTLTGAAQQRALMWAQTKESSVSETRKQKVHCYFFTVVVLESVYGCFWNNGFI